MITSPTRTYTSLDAAYDHFNRELFAGQLPACLITMQRKRGARGYFSPERFVSVDASQDVTDEIALNPIHFAKRSSTATLSTLVHEMAHVWQFHFGKRSRGGYHNKNWAEKMREVGLIPSDTGEPGGKETGQKMTHYIEVGGRFDRACAAYLATSEAVLYHDQSGDQDETQKKKAASKTKYTCPVCGLNAWAKPGVNLACVDCSIMLEADQPAEMDAESLEALVLAEA